MSEIPMTPFPHPEAIAIVGPPDYTALVREHLSRVLETWTGWAVVHAIVRSGKSVRIVPPATAEQGGPDDTSARLRPRACQPLPDLLPVRRESGDSEAPGRERFRLLSFLRGLGGGRDAEVRYWPTVPGVRLICSKRQEWSEAPPAFARHRGPDDVLLHELAHAL